MEEGAGGGRGGAGGWRRFRDRGFGHWAFLSEGLDADRRECGGERAVGGKADGLADGRP
jgi:hypothetical protein